MKKILSGFIIIIIIFTVLQIIPTSSVTANSFFTGETLVYAHAGGKGVMPDNTLKAMQYAFDIGVDVLEMDVQLTADDVVVLRHGENTTGNINEYADCDLLIWEHDYEALKNNCNVAYNYQTDGEYLYRDISMEDLITEGIYLTSLEDIFSEFGNQILYNIEIKVYPTSPRNDLADKVIELIEVFELESHVLLATSADDVSQYIVSSYPNILMSTSLGATQDFVYTALPGGSLFYQNQSYVALEIPTSYGVPVIGTLQLDTRWLIYQTQRHNMAMIYWTINDEETMRDLVKKGVDGIITDYPELLIKIINEENES
jgi:glycerophosphoryl diester phosphodiesterase